VTFSSAGLGDLTGTLIESQSNLNLAVFSASVFVPPSAASDNDHAFLSGVRDITVENIPPLG
jgi:hypothetical protein